MSGLDDIVVTARRTSERLQDVPVAVTAFSGEMLQQRQVLEVADLARVTPGLVITPINAPTTLAFTIRGLGNANPNTGSDASVGLYFNDVPVNLQNGTNLGMFDLEDVQVLKGPQGTLFGRNSTGGAVLINSKRPTDHVEGYAEIGHTFFEIGSGWQGKAVFNLPLAEGLAVRAGVSAVDRDGWIRNILDPNTPASVFTYGQLPAGSTKFDRLGYE